MTFSSRESVASGRPYLVVEVSGGHPVGLDDFVGDVWFVAGGVALMVLVLLLGLIPIVLVVYALQNIR